MEDLSEKQSNQESAVLPGIASKAEKQPAIVSKAETLAGIASKAKFLPGIRSTPRLNLDRSSEQNRGRIGRARGGANLQHDSNLVSCDGNNAFTHREHEVRNVMQRPRVAKRNFRSPKWRRPLASSWRRTGPRAIRPPRTRTPQPRPPRGCAAAPSSP